VFRCLSRPLHSITWHDNIHISYIFVSLFQSQITVQNFIVMNLTRKWNGSNLSVLAVISQIDIFFVGNKSRSGSGFLYDYHLLLSGDDQDLRKISPKKKHYSLGAWLLFTSWTEGTSKGNIICWNDYWFGPVFLLVLSISICLRLWLCRIK